MKTVEPAISSPRNTAQAVQAKRLDVMRLGRKSYAEVWDLQKHLVDRRKAGEIPDTLVLVEHDPVYTLGKNANEDHLLQSRPSGIPVYRIERGGDVTYHGPGQLVGYPILDLHDHRLSVSWYMRSLEKVILNSLAHFRIDATRRQGLTGVWVQDEKIAALGVRLSRWVSMHGFALNVCADLVYFDGIIPCGLFEHGVTSMDRVLGRRLSIRTVEDVVVAEFANVFDFSSISEN